jgi:hypothetical protein
VPNNNASTNPHKQDGSIGVKQLAHAIGLSPKSTRQMLRRKFGRHQSWDLWLLTKKQAEQIIAEYREDRR